MRHTGEGRTINDPESEPDIVHSQSVLKSEIIGGKATVHLHQSGSPLLYMYLSGGHY